MNKIKKTNTYLTILICVFSINAFAEATQKFSLSTSPFIPVQYENEKGDLIQTCEGKKASFGANYISMRIEKFTVNKSENKFKALFSRKKHVFASSTFSASYNGQQLKTTRVSHPVSIKSKDKSVDLGESWQLLDKTPWNLVNAKIQFSIGYGATSTAKSIIDAFAAVTGSIPDHTVSTNLSTGLLITNAVDKLLFGASRDFFILNSSHDLPVSPNNLCEGVYVIFSSEKSDNYEKYYNDKTKKLTWDSNLLKFESGSIKDVSYVILSVGINKYKYKEPKFALNDSATWSRYYRDAQNILPSLVYTDESVNMSVITKNFIKKMNEARVLLEDDNNLLNHERNVIHDYVMQGMVDVIDILAARVDSNGVVTTNSTLKSLESLYGSSGNLQINEGQKEKLSRAINILKNKRRTIDPSITADYIQALGNIKEASQLKFDSSVLWK